MTRRITEILSWHASDNPGTLTDLSRMLSHGTLAGTGKMVILPVDQGFEHGPTSGRALVIDVCAYAAQIAAQLGAHIIKVKPPTEFIEQDAARKVSEDQGIKIGALADHPRRRLRHDHGPQLLPASPRRRRRAAPRGHGDPPHHVAELN